MDYDNKFNLLLNYNSLLDQNLNEYFGDINRLRKLKKSCLITDCGALTSRTEYKLKNAKLAQKKYYSNKILLEDNVTSRYDKSSREIREKLYRIKRSAMSNGGQRSALLYQRQTLPPPRLSYEDLIPTKTNTLNDFPSCQSTERKQYNLNKNKSTTSKNIIIPKLSFSEPDFSCRFSRVNGPYDSVYEDHSNVCNPSKTERQQHSGRTPRFQNNMSRVFPHVEKSPRNTGRGNKSITKSLNEDSEPNMTMQYFGCSLNLDCEQKEFADDTKITQQINGGESIVVFQGKVAQNDIFSFTTLNKPNFPFSLTIYVNEKFNCRISTCCAFRHSIGKKLGNKNGYFSICDVQGEPCYRCKMRSELGNRSKEYKKRLEIEVPDENSGDDETGGKCFVRKRNVKPTNLANAFTVEAPDDEYVQDMNDRNSRNKNKDSGINNNYTNTNIRSKSPDKMSKNKGRNNEKDYDYNSDFETSSEESVETPNARKSKINTNPGRNEKEKRKHPRNKKNFAENDDSSDDDFDRLRTKNGSKIPVKNSSRRGSTTTISHLTGSMSSRNGSDLEEEENDPKIRIYAERKSVTIEYDRKKENSKGQKGERSSSRKSNSSSSSSRTERSYSMSFESDEVNEIEE